MKKPKKSVLLIYEVSIYPIYLIPELLTFKFPRFVGAKNIQYPLVEEWRNRTLRGVGSFKSTDELADFILKKVRKDPKWTQKAIRKYYYWMDSLLDFLKRAAQSRVRASNADLWGYFKEFKTLYTRMYLWGWIPNAIEGVGLSNQFSNLLKQYLSRKLRDKKMANEYFSVLTTSTRPLLREEQEKDFLRIVMRITKNKALKKKFEELEIEDLIAKLSDLDPALERSIERHRTKYAWLFFKYEGPEWDKIYLLALIRDFLKSGKDPSQKLKQIDESKRTLGGLQAEYIKRFNLNSDKELGRLLRIAREFMYLKEHQKDSLFQCYYLLDGLVREAAARLNLSPTQFRHMIQPEIKKALVDGKYDVDLLNERIKHCVMVFREGEPIRVIIGKEADLIAKREFPPLRKKSSFSGQCACAGHVRGRAKIIQETKDMIKMQEGDILVTTRTNPNLLPAIRKAGAIVADVGGIGSHAAIIARELKIPCVVGVGTASMILNDGDILDVDATCGLVKKL